MHRRLSRSLQLLLFLSLSWRRGGRTNRSLIITRHTVRAGNKSLRTIGDGRATGARPKANPTAEAATVTMRRISFFSFAFSLAAPPGGTLKRDALTAPLAPRTRRPLGPVRSSSADGTDVCRPLASPNGSPDHRLVPNKSSRWRVPANYRERLHPPARFREKRCAHVFAGRKPMNTPFGRWSFLGFPGARYGYELFPFFFRFSFDHLTTRTVLKRGRPFGNNGIKHIRWKSRCHPH